MASISNVPDKRKRPPAPRKRSPAAQSPAPDAEPFPDEPPAPQQSPITARTRTRGGDSLPAGWEFARLIGAPVYGATFAASFARAIVRDPNGNERAVILRRMKPDSPGSIIWEGDIRIIGRYSAYKITPGRVLKTPDWSDFLIVESIDRMGVSSNPVAVAAMDLVQAKPKAFWADQLKVSLTGRVSYIAEYIRLCGAEWGKPSSLMINGQGPLWLRDGSPIPNKLLDHSLVFVTRSRVFDTKGNTRDVIPDLTRIPESFGYYDLTPDNEISPDQISRGCERFREAYAECPGFPVIPAAFLGQLFTGSLAATDPRYFTAILQTGLKGSGKTRYAARWDAVQSRESRDMRMIKPVLNLGDKTTTVKGPKYRMADFGGYSITVDDVLKDGDSPAQVQTGSDAVSNLLRSYDSGGAALAGVDYARNEVVGRESPALHSSIRVMSEISIVGNSTLDRMMVMPAIGAAWGPRSPFNRDISIRLSEPAAVDEMHRAYSAFVQWLFTRIDTGAADAYAKARAETETWEIDSRYAERYAGAVAGHYLFTDFCASVARTDITAQVNAAVGALRECARSQASASVPLAERWAAGLRRAIILEKIAFPGPAEYDPDGMMVASYSVPWAKGEPADDHGVSIPKRIMPGNGLITYSDLGMVSQGPAPVVPQRAVIGGFTLPPRSDTGGHKGNPLTRIDHAGCKKERFAEMCRIVSSVTGSQFDPNAVMDSLRAHGHGDIMRIRGMSPAQERAWVFDLVWALKSRED